MEIDDIKASIFFGFAVLWIVWGIVDLFFDYALQVYLGVLSLVLIVWIGAVAWNNVNMFMMPGSVRVDNSIRIP